jgi:putative ABC transport system permease protein
MLKNYFTIALRALWKSKLFTAINILGLSIGISASLVIFLLVNHHFSFDKFESGKERIYRVVSNFSFSGELYHNSGVPCPMAAGVRKELTGLEQVVSFRTWDSDVKVTIPAANNKPAAVFKKQASIVFADSNYFRLIGYKWISGSATASLSDPNQAVLTESIAHLYFPGVSASDLTGKIFYFNDTVPVTVTGVVQDLASNTDFHFKTFVSNASLETRSLKPNGWDQWNSTNGAQQLWVKLSNNTKSSDVEKQLNALYKKNDKREPGDKSKSWISLQPLNDLHFNADYGAYHLAPGHKPTLYGLLAIAAFLLILACINFINLTTANASQRAKEIGIRKTMGSTRKQLVLQFLGETFLLSFIATLISVASAPLIMKAFSGFIPDGLQFSLSRQPLVVPFLLLLILLVTLLSGFYPALVLSGFKPVLILKNLAYTNTGKTRNAWLRKTLTVSQFVIAQVFIMGAILVSKQITYSLSRDLGFRKDAILYTTTNYYDTVASHKYVFLEKLKAIPGVAMVSLASDPPSSGNTWSGIFNYKDGKREIQTDVRQKFGDTNYIHLYDIRLLAGNNIPKSDTINACLINETYARLLGFTNPAEAVGKKLEWSNKQIPIVGVVADFHQKSMHEPIKALAIGSWQTTERTVSIALQQNALAKGQSKKIIGKIEKAWKEVYPEEDFEYSFFDQDIAKFYEAEQNISGLLKWATGLSVFISCLGLLGLVLYSTTQRTKEIGVRKVLGASVMQIVSLVSRDFIFLVLLAFLIAAPIAGIGMYKWLQNFAYRTDLSWWIFVLGGSLMVVIALVTLAFQTIRAARANPVSSLRTE